MTPQWIAAAVWAIDRAEPAQLRVLGNILNAWKSERSDIAEIHGLERLLDGTYPWPFGPYDSSYSPAQGAMPEYDKRVLEKEGQIEFVQAYIIEPWRQCPAVVLAKRETYGDEIRPSLKKVIPPSLGRVGIDFFLP